MSKLREAMARLTPEQRIELEARLVERRADGDQLGIPARPDRSEHPMSAGQERIFAMARLRPDAAVYNLQQAYRIEGPLERDRLEAALTGVVERHDALRARFELADGTAVQTVDPSAGAMLEVDDLTALPAEERSDAAHARAARDATHAFDLAAGGLFMARLVVLDAEEHLLIMTAHHIVCDGWSMNVIERELAALYRGESLRELPLQASDVAAWERSRGGLVEADLNYWRDQLDGVQALKLPTGKRCARATSDQGGHHTHLLAAHATARTLELSREARVTPHAILLAGFTALLNRATAQEDLVVCSPAAGRVHPSTHDLVGYFNNVVALRADLSGNPTFSELVGRLRSVVAEAFDHQAAPFQLVAGMPEVATTTLTRGLFILQESPEATLDLPGAVVSPVEIEADSADFDLALFVRQIGGQYRVVVRYRRQLFSSADIEHLLVSYEELLGACLAGPERRLDELPSWSVPNADAEPAPSVEPRSGGPQSLLESQLREIWEDVFQRRPIGVHDDFFELGGHSLLAAALMREIEEKLVEEPLPLAALFQAPTIAELGALIESGGWKASWSALVPIQPNGERPPLFFVHAHGGNVIGYRDLARRLGDDQPFFGLQAPEVGADEEPRKLEEMAASYISEIQTVQRHGPYLVGGWCLGGDVALEMAHQLRRSGERVALVLMVDNPRPEFIAAARAGAFVERLSNRVTSRVDMEWVNLQEVPASQRFLYLRRRAIHAAEWASVKLEGALDGTAVRVPHSRAYRAHALAQDHEKAYQAYDPPAYDGRVAVIRAEHQRSGTPGDPTLGWDRVLTGERELIEAPGHRIGLLSEPRVAVVSRLIAEALDRAVTEDAAQEE